MRQRHHAILVALLLAVVALQSAAARQATPPADIPERQVVELPGTRIVALSPDGTRFVAATEADFRPTHLCVYDVATLTERACGDLEEHRIAISLDSVVWSPDSTRIAFAEEAFRYFVDGDLWLMDAASGEITNLTDDGYEGRIGPFDNADLPETPVYADVLPAWATDSQSIAFSRSPIFRGEFRGNQIVSIDLTSGQVETLAPVTLDTLGVVYRGMAWATDGRRLYYSVAYPESDSPRNGIWVYDRAREQIQHLLTNDPEKGPPALVRVAATGQTALIIYPFWLSQELGTSDYYALIDLESNRLTTVHPIAPDPAAPHAVVAATFSPDGTRVLYAVQYDDGVTSLLTRELPDGQPEVVIADLDLDESFVPTMTGGGLFWAADGTVFIVTGADSGLLFDLDSGPVA